MPESTPINKSTWIKQKHRFKDELSDARVSLGLVLSDPVLNSMPPQEVTILRQAYGILASWSLV